jgi:tRNA pseudouridine55 synthase
MPNAQGIGPSAFGIEMNGVLVVDKPIGPTSHDVVARARAILGVRRIGHTGTLDPLASGVLPLVVGRATRLARFLAAGDKTYEAVIRLGAATETYDAGSAPAPRPAPPPGVTEDAVAAALDAFRGTFWQAPPPYSAKRIAGVRAYELARAARPAEPKAVEVTVRELTLDGYDAGAARLRVVCSAGFYVRSLAHDLGAGLGCGGYLEALRRTASAGFRLADAVPLATLERDPPRAVDGFVPMDHLLTDLPAAVLSPRGAERAAHGNAVTGLDIVRRLPGLDGPGRGAEPSVRLLDGAGALLAVARMGPGAVLHPVVVLI